VAIMSSAFTQVFYSPVYANYGLFLIPLFLFGGLIFDVTRFFKGESVRSGSIEVISEAGNGWGYR